MKKLIVILLVLSLLLCGCNQKPESDPAQFEMPGLKWGMSPDEVLQSGSKLLSIEVTTVSGRTLTYDFYSYGERYVLAAADGSASFYTLSRHVKKLATDIQKLVADQAVEADPFY